MRVLDPPAPVDHGVAGVLTVASGLLLLAIRRAAPPAASASLLVVLIIGCTTMVHERGPGARDLSGGTVLDRSGTGPTRVVVLPEPPPPPSSSPYPAHTNPVFLSRSAGPFPRHVVIREISFASRTYGGSAQVLKAMADRARELGGDAVVGFKTWRQPAGMSGFAWAAPHASGTVIKLLDVDPQQEFRSGTWLGEWR